jgi:uncharacterized protein (TIGR02594 family)
MEEHNMSLISYAVRPVADWTAGILLCTFVAIPFAQGYFGVGKEQLADMLKAEISDLTQFILPDWMQSGVDEYSPESQSAIIATAEKWLGKTEDADRKELAAFIAQAGITINPADTAWCAAFANAVLYANGIKGTGAVNAKSFLEWGKKTTTPSEGDIVVLWRGSPQSWKGHVGFYKGTDSNGNILILGGNQGDAVSIEAFNATRVLGYRTNRRLDT